MSSRRGFLTFIGASSVMMAFAFLAGCGGGSSNASNTIVSSGDNVAPISVNAGPAGDYANGGFVSVTVCVPGTSNCQTVNDVLVDTGSSGLRILSSAFSLALPPQESSGNPVFECFPFESGYTWGPVQTADIEIANEKASSAPVQIIGTNIAVPQGCTDFGLPSSNTLDTLGANGIIGVGLFVQDCGGYCEQVQTAAGNPNIYYQCASSECQAIGESLSLQVPNPVTLFATDNNGVIIELPNVSGGEPSLSGSLVFGIGTESNNALGGATVYTADSSGSFTTTYSGTAYSGSFIDSGSNGLFFPSTITECASNSDASGFYCPSATENLSASNQGVNGSTGTVNFSIANAVTLFDSNDYVFNNLGGPASGYFDWGLPFFYGQNVFTGIQSATYPNGYWAY
jgi:Protein of unknown function (DUF3443)